MSGEMRISPGESPALPPVLHLGAWSAPKRNQDELRRAVGSGQDRPPGMGHATAGRPNRVEEGTRHFASSVRNPQWRAARNHDAWGRG